MTVEPGAQACQRAVVPVRSTLRWPCPLARGADTPERLRKVPENRRSSMKTGFEIAVFAGWLLCIINLVSVGRHPTADFQGIARSRPRWAWISVLGIVPYLGIFTSVAYFVRVSIWLPEKFRLFLERGQCPAGARRLASLAVMGWPR